MPRSALTHPPDATLRKKPLPSSDDVLRAILDRKSKILSRKTLDERLARIFDGHLSAQVRLSSLGKKLALVPFVSEEAETLQLHSHDYLELIFILAGEGTHQIGEREYPVSGGQIFFLDNTLPHAFRRPKNGRLLYVNFSFLPALLSGAGREDQWQPGLHFALVEPFFSLTVLAIAFDRPATRATTESQNDLPRQKMSQG